MQNISKFVVHVDILYRYRFSYVSEPSYALFLLIPAKVGKKKKKKDFKNVNSMQVWIFDKKSNYMKKTQLMVDSNNDKQSVVHGTFEL